MRIIILPGLDGTAQLLDDFCRELACDADVIRYPPNLASYTDLVALVQNLLPVNEDYILIAESFSGPIATELAATKPNGLLGVVFVATFAQRPIPVPSVLASTFGLLPVKSRLLTWAAQPILMGRWRNPSFTQKFRAALIDLPQSVLANRVKEVLRIDVTQRLTSLEIPSLYLRPNQDRLVPLSASAHFPDIQSLKGPHFILQARPKESAEIIQEFLKRF